MAPKKKKGKKKKKSSATEKKADDDQPKPVNEPPIFRDPVLDAPVATLKCQLANPGLGLIQMELKMRTSCKLYSLQQRIKELHGGSIEQIRICMNSYQEDQAWTDPRTELKTMGIATEGPFTILYDYDVIPRPLLTTPMNYKVLDNDSRY